jgi:hypothetical protein
MGDIFGRELRARALELCTFLHSRSGKAVHFSAQGPWEVARGSRIPERCRSTARAPVCPSGLHDGGRGSWGTWERVDELPDTAGAQPDGGGELPQRVPGLLGGDQGLAVDLVRLGGLLRRLLHAGEQVLRGPTWSSLCLRL